MGMGGACSRDRGMLGAWGRETLPLRKLRAAAHCAQGDKGPYATLRRLFHTGCKHELIVAEVEVCYNTRRYAGCRAIQYDRKGPR